MIASKAKHFANNSCRFSNVFVDNCGSVYPEEGGSNVGRQGSCEQCLAGSWRAIQQDTLWWLFRVGWSAFDIRVLDKCYKLSDRVCENPAVTNTSAAPLHFDVTSGIKWFVRSEFSTTP